MERLDEKISKIKEQRTALFRDIAAFSKRVHERDEARLRDCRANTLIDLVKKVFIDLKLNYPGNLDGVEDTKKTRLIKAALSLNQQQLESFFKENGKKVGPQYFKVLQNITHVRHSKKSPDFQIFFLDQIPDLFSFFFFSTLMGDMKRRTKRRPTLLSYLARINTKRQGNTISGGIFSPMSMVNLLPKLWKLQLKREC